MIRKVFLDTNIVMDWILNRTPFDELADKIFIYHIDHDFDLYLSALSLANMAYVMQGQKKKPHDAVLRLLKWVKVIPLTKDIIIETTNSDFRDFEDGLHHFSATTISDMDVIITRNTKDFKHSSILVLSPEEFISKFTK